MRSLDALYRYLQWANMALASAAALLVLGASVAVSGGVLGRNLTGMSTTWELEGSVYAVVLATFLGAAYTDATGGQVASGLFGERLPKGLDRIRVIVLDLLALGLFAALLISGWTHAYEAYSLGWRSDTVWGPPMWIPYAAIPAGALMLCLTFTCRILIRLLGGEVVALRPKEH